MSSELITVNSNSEGYNRFSLNDENNPQDSQKTLRLGLSIAAKVLASFGVLFTSVQGGFYLARHEACTLDNKLVICSKNNFPQGVAWIVASIVLLVFLNVIAVKRWEK